MFTRSFVEGKEMKPTGGDPEALYVLEASKYIVLSPAMLMGKVSFFNLQAHISSL